MTDTSKEAVERAICNPIIRMVDRGGSPSLDACGLMIDTARALLAERDALQAQLNDPAHAARVLGGAILTRNVVDCACLSFNHSFGLMGEDEQSSLRFQAHEWARSLFRAIAEQEQDT